MGLQLSERAWCCGDIHMKTTALSYFAATCVIGLVLGIAFDALPLALFGITVSSLLLLIAATDYSPRASYNRVLAARRHTFPLAA